MEGAGERERVGRTRSARETKALKYNFTSSSRRRVSEVQGCLILGSAGAEAAVRPEKARSGASEATAVEGGRKEDWKRKKMKCSRPYRMPDRP